MGMHDAKQDRIDKLEDEKKALERVFKETFNEVTECCGRSPLIEVHSEEGSWSHWEFCPHCLECSETIPRDEYDLIQESGKKE